MDDCCRSLRGNVDCNTLYMSGSLVGLRRSLRGNVDCNYSPYKSAQKRLSSFPSRERGLQHYIGYNYCPYIRSRSLRGNVDCNKDLAEYMAKPQGRSLRGNVDCNGLSGLWCPAPLVVPFAGTWIATKEICLRPEELFRRSLRGNVDCNCNLIYDCQYYKWSFPSRERGLQRFHNLDISTTNASFPSRERGLQHYAFWRIQTLLSSFPSRERGLQQKFFY